MEDPFELIEPSGLAELRGHLVAQGKAFVVADNARSAQAAHSNPTEIIGPDRLFQELLEHKSWLKKAEEEEFEAPLPP